MRFGLRANPVIPAAVICALAAACSSAHAGSPSSSAHAESPPGSSSGSSSSGSSSSGAPPLTVLTHGAVTVRLDLAARVATLIRSDDQPEGQVAQVEGNAQTTRNGDLFVGWGALPYVSEFSPSGKLLYNAQLPTGVSSYRAYRLPWPAAR